MRAAAHFRIGIVTQLCQRQRVTALGNHITHAQIVIGNERGELRRFVNVYLNDEDIRFAQGKGTLVKDGDEISVIPAIAGG